MAQPDQASLENLRHSLPLYDENAALSEELRAFCRFYGINFADQREGVTHRVGRVESGAYQLAVHSWQQEGADRNLLLVHGYTDHAGLFGHLVKYGLDQNCNVYIFDLPGHGLSSGEPVVVDDFGDYSQAIVSVLDIVHSPELPIWAVGQSTGCAALMDYATKYPWNFSAAVFLAPLIRPAGWHRIRFSYLLLHRFRDEVERKFTENSGDPAFLNFLQNDPLAPRQLSVRWVGALRRWLSGLEFKDLGAGPLLVIQGDADGTVSWRYNMKHIVELFPGCEIEYLPGAGHHLANESRDIREHYLERITRFLAAGTPASEKAAGQSESLLTGI